MREPLLRNFRTAIKWNTIYLIVCLALLPLVIFFSFCKPWEIDYDFWEYAAIVRELSVNFLHPSDPMIQMPGDTCPRFVPYTMFWGFLKKVTTLSTFATMGLAGLTNYVIFVFGLYRFVSKQFKSDSLPTYTLLTMLLVWGSGYGWANAYHLEMFLVTLPYIGFFTFGLSLNALYHLNCYCENNTWHDLFLYSLFSIVAFVSHPITGAFCFVVALAMLLSYKNFTRVALLQSIPLLAFGVCLIWPYFNYWDIFTKGTNPETGWWGTTLFHNQVKALGAAIIGFPIALVYALKRKYLFVLYGLLFCLLIYTVSYFTGIEIGDRFIIFITFFLHLAIVLYIKENDIFTVQKIKRSLQTDGLVIILIVMLLVPSGDYRIQEMMRHVGRIVDRPFKVHRYYSPAEPYLFLSEYLSDSDVVLAHAFEGGVIPTITGARIVARRHATSPLIVHANDQRKQDVSRFFNGQLSLQERKEVMTKYHVTHIMVNLKDEKNWEPSFTRDLEVLGREITRKTTIIEAEKKVENTIILYKVVSIESVL